MPPPPNEELNCWKQDSEHWHYCAPDLVQL